MLLLGFLIRDVEEADRARQEDILLGNKTAPFNRCHVTYPPFGFTLKTIIDNNKQWVISWRPSLWKWSLLLLFFLFFLGHNARMENLHHHHHTTPPNSPREQGDSWQQKTFTPTFESGVWVYACVYITATAIGLQPNPYLFQCFLFFAVYEETIAKPRQWVSLHLRAITTSRERVCVCVCVFSLSFLWHRTKCHLQGVCGWVLFHSLITVIAHFCMALAVNATKDQDS